MKTLKDICSVNASNSLHSLFEASIIDNAISEASLLDIEDTLSDGDVKVPHKLIQKYLEENYAGTWTISEKPNKDGLFEVSSNGTIKVKNEKITSLTNGLFIWTSVKGDFNCCFCQSLESLYGAPKEVGKSFDCSNCQSLKTLEGAPEIIKGDFDCSYCYELKSLEGAPKEVYGSFNCSDCKGLKSLKGAPKKVGGGFNCARCNSLVSLDGCSKAVEGYFSCSFCDLLKSLKGGPEYVGGGFNCYDCKSLESLDGCPKTIGGNFLFYRNKLKISKLEIRLKCKIKGKILLE